MGELHVEVILDLVICEYKVLARLRELHIAYWESPTVRSVKESGIYNIMQYRNNILKFFGTGSCSQKCPYAYRYLHRWLPLAGKIFVFQPVIHGYGKNL